MARTKPMWVKGMKSPNPKGRPSKEVSLTNDLKEQLRKTPHQRRAIIERLIKMAMAGDLKAIQTIMDRIDGKIQEIKPITTNVGVQVLFTPVEKLPDSEKPRALLEGQSEDIIEGEARVLAQTNGITIAEE